MIWLGRICGNCEITLKEVGETQEGSGGVGGGGGGVEGLRQKNERAALEVIGGKRGKVTMQQINSNPQYILLLLLLLSVLPYFLNGKQLLHGVRKCT